MPTLFAGMNKIGKYHTERLSITNLSDVGKLHTAVYGKQAPPDFFSVKYDTDFTGVRHTGFIAYNSEQLPIAFYAVIPCFIQSGNKTVLAAQSADTMAHPDYRHRGLFVELAMRTFDLCRTVGIAIIFGFPNQNSLPGFINKLGWEMTGKMDYFIIRTSPFSWQRILLKCSLSENLFTRYRQKQLNKYLLPQPGIANSVVADGFDGVYRDGHYLKYKTYTTTYAIKIGEAALWIKMDNELLIGDISLLPGDFDDVMYKLKKLAVKLGMKEIHFHASPGTTLHTLFAMRFKPMPSFPVILKRITEDVAIDRIKFTSADIDTF